MELNTCEKSYQLHANAFANYTKGNAKHQRARSWLKDDNVNSERLKRVYSIIDPFVELFPNSSWMTVGDGRYGLDAQYLNCKGVDALPTDISEYLLKEAKQEGMINSYSVENAEKLTFADNSFDFVFCKEAYHHFPRPAIAIYEMLRVAKQGIVLLEPIDRHILPWPQAMMNGGKNLIKKCLENTFILKFLKKMGIIYMHYLNERSKNMLLGLA